MKAIATTSFLLIALATIVEADCSANYDNCIEHNLDTADGCYHTYLSCHAQEAKNGGLVGYCC